MKNNFKKTKTFLFTGVVTTISLIFGGCENSFFASPANLLTPSPDLLTTPTVSVSSTVTPTPTPTPVYTPTPEGSGTPTPTPAPTDAPAATDTPTPLPTSTPIPTVQTAFDAPVTDPNDYTFIVNREHPLPDGYEPEDLVYIEHAYNTKSSEDKYKLRRYAARAFDEMCTEAFETEGLNIVGISGYRSYERQYSLYAGYLIKDGISHTNYYSAVPGSSEHQTGLAIDISCRSCGYNLVNSFAKSLEGKWVAENAWRFGFILRYKEDDVAITGYAYEPWHIRYVGIPLARYLFNGGLTLEEYYGCPESIDRAYLDVTPLIDTSSVKFGKVYQDKFSSVGTLAYTDSTKTQVIINKETCMPYLIPYVSDIFGKAIKDADGKYYASPAVKNTSGQVFPGKNTLLNVDASLIAVKPAVFVGGTLFLDSNGTPCFCDPLTDNLGKLCRDTAGNILFYDVLRVPGSEELILDSSGSPIFLVPKRDNYGYPLINDMGKIEFYYPVMDTNGEYARTEEGELIWPSEYEDKLFFEQFYETTEISPFYIVPEEPAPTEPSAEDRVSDETEAE